MMGKSSRFGVPLLLAVVVTALWLTGLPLAAQTNGDIKGQVQDAQGQPIPGMTVKLLQAGKGDPREQVSDAAGSFQFADLAAGVYIVTVAQEGYSPVTCPGLRIVGVSRQVWITLVPAGGEQQSSCRQAEAG
jgi:hypothetical protein